MDIVKLAGQLLVLFLASMWPALAADPVEVVYGTYLGGSEKDGANAIALRTDGGVYVAGGTPSGDPGDPRLTRRAIGGASG